MRHLFTQIAEASPQATVPAQPDLESMLLALTLYGRPGVARDSGDGWYASIKMHTSAPGADFDIFSEFRMESPTAAVTQITERVLSVVAQIGGPR